MNEIYLFIVMLLCVLFLMVGIYILTLSKKPKDMTKLERLYKLKQYFLHNLGEDPIDSTEFDCTVLNAFEFLEERYKDE